MAKKNANGGSVAGYFRKVFAENPGLLHGRSNQELLDRWLSDHPGAKEVPRNVKANLQNVKSVLRQQARKRKGGRPRKAVGTAAAPNGPLAAPELARPRGAADEAAPSALERLEERIDDCLVMAKRIDAEGLRDVVAYLRRARNAVVWMQGQ